MRRLLIFLFLLGINITVHSQTSIDALIKRLADTIIANTPNGVKLTNSGEQTTDYSKLENSKGSLYDTYREWGYWNGVVNLSMFEMYKYYNDEKYGKFITKNYEFVFDNAEVFKKYSDNKQLEGLEQFWTFEYLDNCGVMAAGLIEEYRRNKRQDYLEYINKTADYILNKEHKLKDGTLARIIPYNKTVWLDDLYMSVPFLARMGVLTGERKYFDFAAKQIKQFTKLLYDSRLRIYYHCWYDDIKQNGVAHWGRANGWSIVAQASLLELLPKNHPERPELIKIFKQQIIGFSRYQTDKGLWHQLLDKNDSYLETSCTAMFTYAIAKGVNQGWIEPRYKSIAIEGWRGIESMVNSKGQVENICTGTSTSTSLVYYYRRPKATNESHGVGIVMMAGIEVLKLPKD